MRSIRARRASSGRARPLLVSLLATLGLSGCPALPDGPRYVGAGHETPVYGGTLMLWDSAKVRTLDPHIAFDVSSGTILQLVYDTLYGYSSDMELEPELAAALPTISDDGRTFTVPLKQGVKFHNGRELTADDVVWSFERLFAPELHSPGVAYYKSIRGLDAFRQGKSEHVAGVRAKGRYLVEFELDAADQSFLHTLAMRFASPLPREAVQRLGRKFEGQPVGTGPYRLTSWDRGVRLVLTRNPAYHDEGQPYLDRVVMEEGLDRETAFLRFRNSEVDFASSIAPPDAHYLRTSPRWRKYVVRTPSADIYGIGMNTEMPPFDNVHVRRAVAFAIDRERWAKARNYLIRPTGQMLPPSIPGYDAHLPTEQRYDLAKAKEEMRLAGYPNGLPEPVKMWSTASATTRRYFELAHSDLSKIGITLEPKMVSFPVYLEETGKPKTAQMFTTGWLMDFPDASNFFSIVSSATKSERESVNRTFFSDPELDALLDAALIERDPRARTAMYRRANEIVAREAPWAFVSNSQSIQAFQPYMRGFRPHAVYPLDIRGVWLDLPKKRVAELMRDTALDARWAGLVPQGGFR